jgi:3-oxoisoapionate kinase
VTPIFSFYGDDFTGSTDALEALALHGVDTVLFLRTPDDDDMRAFAHCRAIGIAGDSRSRSPEWMRTALPPIFQRLRQIGAPMVQYKICSTFDSSPETGSIGCALEIGQEVFEVSSVPIVPAAPLLGRYVVFGNLFATANGSIHRIDRHPSMQSHPVTPMSESDLLLHLARQTSRALALVNILDLRNGTPSTSTTDAVLYDGLDPADLARTAEIITSAAHKPIFVIASSGFTYGLLDYWRAQCPPAPASASRTDRLLVLSGSCSPTTERQICHALRNGFRGIRIGPEAETEALAQLADGRSVILYTALGSSDRLEIADHPAHASSLGRLLHNIIRSSGVTRVVIAGGDTASHAVHQLNLTALTFVAPIERGAPLCRAHGWHSDLELVLKGGQVGSDSFFEKVLSCP